MTIIYNSYGQTINTTQLQSSSGTNVVFDSALTPDDGVRVRIQGAGNDAGNGAGYRVGTPTATTDLAYTISFENNTGAPFEVSEIQIDMGFFNNDVDDPNPGNGGLEGLNNWTVNNGTINLNYANQGGEAVADVNYTKLTAVAESPASGNWTAVTVPAGTVYAPNAFSFGVNANGTLTISSSIPFSVVTFLFDYLSPTGNPFGIILSELRYTLPTPLGAQDSDGDTISDFVDLDDDNDGILDTIEYGCSTSASATAGVIWDSNRGTTNGNTGAAKINRYEPNIVNSSSFQANAQDAIFGTGLIDLSEFNGANEVQNEGYYYVSGADAPDIATAKTNNDYLEFTFSALDDVSSLLRSVAIHDIPSFINGTYGPRGTNLGNNPLLNPIYPDYKFQVEISVDNFASSIVLVSDRLTSRPLIGTFSGPPNADTSEFVNLGGNAFLVTDNTTYKVRIYIYASEDITLSGFATFDNFALQSNTCTSFDPDADGIGSALDLDSDNDGCADIEEAGGNFTVADDGVTAIGTLADGNSAQVTTNLGNTVGATSVGVPNVAGAGQAIANTQDGINYCIDTDNDEIPDEIDLDDDNDGILDVDECPGGPTPNFSVFTTNPLNVSTTITEGTITQDGQTIPFTITHPGTINPFDGQYSANNTDAAGGLFSDASIYNPPNPIGAFEHPKYGLAGTYTIVFDQPITNPRMNVWSVGDGGFFTGPPQTPELTFNRSVTLISTRTLTSPGIDGTNASLVQTSSNAVVSNDGVNNLGGNGTIEISGTFTTFSFDVDTAELFWVFNFSTFDVLACDIDGDGISAALDLDSDGDGCPDAVEGDLIFEQIDLTDATSTGLNVPNNNNNDGSITTGYLGSTTESVLFNLGTTVDTDPVSATYGVPLSTLANTPNTQGIGDSQDVNVDGGCCDIVMPTLAPN